MKASAISTREHDTDQPGQATSVAGFKLNSRLTWSGLGFVVLFVFFEGQSGEGGRSSDKHFKQVISDDC